MQHSNNEKPVVLILAGGKGERFWPRSGKKHPKYLQKIYSSKTLLEETLDRALLVTSKDRIFIGCSLHCQEAICKTHPEIPKETFIIEPCRRSTAPMIALASLFFEKRFPKAVHVVMPADHYIARPDVFADTIHEAVRAARKEFLITLGISPKRPETQYGYIHAGEKISETEARAVFLFKEKPDKSTAEKYLAAGSYFWNSGIFVWSGNLILQELSRHAPEIFTPLSSSFRFSSWERSKDFRFAFANVPALSIDVAVMEKSKKAAVVPARFHWDDLGSWMSLERILDCDTNGNTLFSSQNTHFVGLGGGGNIVAVDDGLVALLDMEDIIVVQERGVLFVVKKSSVSRIKELLKHIRENTSLRKYLD